MISPREVYGRRDGDGFRPTPALVRAWGGAGATRPLRDAIHVADLDGRASSAFVRLWWNAFGARPPAAEPILTADGKATAYLVRSWPG